MTGAARATLLISAALAGTAACLTAIGTTRPVIDNSVPVWAFAVGLTVAFFLGEQLLMNIEFRQQAHSLTLAGIPLAVGAMVAPLWVLVASRVLGAGIALALQRMSADKVTYNLSAYAFEAAALSTVLHLLLGSARTLELLPALVVLVATIVIDQVMSCLVLCVIRLHAGPLSRRDVADVLLPALVLSAPATAAAVGILLLASHGPIGLVVIVVGVLATLVLYRGYLATMRRHQALELIHEFVTGSAGAQTFSAAVTALLPRMRDLLRATSVTLTVVPGAQAAERAGVPAGAGLRVVDTEDGCAIEAVTAEQANAQWAADWAAVRAVSQSEPFLAPRAAKDRAVQGWLRERGHRDAMVVPLPADDTGMVGTVVVADRLGETATFTADDLTLLQTLTGHLAVATTSARLVERLAHDATHDSLTGLINRHALIREIDTALAADPDRSRTPAVFVLDLDRFKEVNDALGHGAGDALLMVVADRLRSAFPAGTTISRLGGDEFAAFVPDVTSAGGEAQATALRIGDCVAAELARPVTVEHAMLSADASIGIALPGPRLAMDLLRQADAAMYAAKGGDAGVTVFHAEMDRGRAENLALLADLRRTLRQHPEHFTLYFQPKIDLRTGLTVSAEALVRWNHPELGVVSPDRFVPLAEASGMIDQFTTLVLAMALRQCRRWVDAGVDISVAVNVSARNVRDPALPDKIVAALHGAGLSADRLIVEITESSVIADPQQTLEVLDQLAGLGVCISLDDFGTGYSSLSYLQRLPVREVKIDKSFVQGLAEAGSSADASRALVGAIAGLGNQLGLRVVAEGAETTDVLTELGELGCAVAQGYVISRPLPAQAFLDWLATRGGHPGAQLHLVAG